jgi:putative ABC transport system substrate-binding protein
VTTPSFFRPVVLGFVALAFTVSAQEPVKVPVVGVLMVMAMPEDPVVPAIRGGLRQFGYVDGTNIRIERRAAQNHMDRLPALARELVDLGADVIVVGGEPTARAARQASSTLPIIIISFDHDPVASGLIDSFSHPSGNVTGVFSRTSELIGKRLELLREALPNASRVAVFWDSTSVRQLEAVEPSTRALGLGLERIELRGSYDYAAAFKAARKKKAQAVVLLFSPMFTQERVRIASLALESKMPTMWQEEVGVKAGGLMSYGPSVAEMFGRSGYYIDRLLKGAKVSDLPVEQASKFRLVVNLKTAKALRLTIPQSILLRADEVIR